MFHASSLIFYNIYYYSVPSPRFITIVAIIGKYWTGEEMKRSLPILAFKGLQRLNKHDQTCRLVSLFLFRAHNKT